MSLSPLPHSSLDVPVRDLPEPAVDWNAFSNRISELNDRTPMVFNPVTKKLTKWIDMTALNNKYGKNSKANKAANKKKQKGKKFDLITCDC
jgi:hypothetical protein